MNHAMRIIPDWNQIETVLLDMDGTLLDLRFDNFFWKQVVPEKYAVHRGIDPQVAWQQLKQRYEEKQGTLDWYCMDHWADELGMDMLALKREVDSHIAWLPGAQQALIRMRSMGKRLVLVTNAHRDSVDVKIARTGLDKYLDAMFSAHDFGFPKEKLDFWKHLMVRESFDRQRTMFIDDSPAVLASAKRFGIEFVVGIRQPDSQVVAREIEQFVSVDGIGDLFAADVPGGSGL